MELDQEVITPQPSIPLATPVGVTVSTTTIPPTTSIPHPCSSRSPSPLPPPLPPLPQTTSTPTTDPHSSRSPSPLPPPLPPLPPAGVAQPTSTQPTHKPSQATSAWTSDLTASVIEDFIPPPTIGPTVPIPDKYLDIFKLFVTQELLENIRDKSNRYASQVLAKFTPITAKEVEAFIGFQFLMGLNRKPSISDYWSKNPVYRYPPIADRISRDRYREISRYLHFVDNTTLAPPGTEGYNRLGKVRPLLNYLTERFKIIYIPGKKHVSR